MIAYMHASMITFFFVGCIRRLNIVPLVARQSIEQMSSFDVPCNVLGHFPIISHIKHIFKFKSIATSMATNVVDQKTTKDLMKALNRLYE